MNFFDLKETKTTSTSSTSQGRKSTGEVSGQRKRSVNMPFQVDDEERAMKMAYLARSVFSNSLVSLIHRLSKLTWISGVLFRVH